MRHTLYFALVLLLAGCLENATSVSADGSDAATTTDASGLELPNSLVYAIGPAAEQPRALAGDRLVYVRGDDNGDWDSPETGALMSTRGTSETIVELAIHGCLPRGLASIGPSVVFVATGQCGLGNNWNPIASDVHLQVTDGQTIPPTVLSEPSEGNGAAPARAVVAQGIYCETGAVQGLWCTDGTPDGTHQVLEEAFVRHVTAVGDRFVAFTETTVAGSGPSWPWAMWVTDGTVDGTRIVTDLQEPVAASASGPDAVCVNTRAGLYVSDLTDEGTQLLPDIEVVGMLPAGERVLLNTVYNAPGGPLTVQVQAFDEAGVTTLLVDGGEAMSALALGATSLFTVENRLYATDGSAAGTQLLVDMEAQEREFDGGFGVAGERVLFGVRRTPLYIPYPEERWEIWSTEGTPETTRVVTEGYKFHRPVQLGDLMTFDSDKQLHALRLDLLP